MPLERKEIVTLILVVIIMILLYHLFKPPSWSKKQKKELLNLFHNKLVFTGEFLLCLVQAIQKNYSYEAIFNKSSENTGYNFITQVTISNPNIAKCFGTKGHWTKQYKIAQQNLLMGSGIEATYVSCIVNKLEMLYDPIEFTFSNDPNLLPVLTNIIEQCKNTPITIKLSSKNNLIQSPTTRADQNLCAPQGDCTPMIVNEVFCNAVLASPNSPLEAPQGGITSSGNVIQDLANCASFYQNSGNMNDATHYQQVCDALDLSKSAGSASGVDPCNNYYDCMYNQMCSGTAPRLAPVCSEDTLLLRSGKDCTQFKNKLDEYDIPSQYNIACATTTFKEAITNGPGAINSQCAMLKNYSEDPDCGLNATNLFKQFKCDDQCQYMKCPPNTTCDTKSLSCKPNNR